MSFDNYEHFKRLVLSSPDSEMEFLDGFDFEWGYKYKVKVNETQLASRLSDGTGFEYEFVEVVSKEQLPEGTEFKLYIDSERYYHELDEDEAGSNVLLKPIDKNVFMYMETVQIEVSEDLLSNFQKIVDGFKTGRGHFTYVNGDRILLVKLELF